MEDRLGPILVAWRPVELEWHKTRLLPRRSYKPSRWRMLEEAMSDPFRLANVEH